jgi:hypothetical protein
MNLIPGRNVVEVKEKRYREGKKQRPKSENSVFRSQFTIS